MPVISVQRNGAQTGAPARAWVKMMPPGHPVDARRLNQSLAHIADFEVGQLVGHDIDNIRFLLRRSEYGENGQEDNDQFFHELDCRSKTGRTQGLGPGSSFGGIVMVVSPVMKIQPTTPIEGQRTPAQ
ncbi:MAG: hypothetical protein AAF492_14895 [Verrucomicrobiota bacterium]